MRVSPAALVSWLVLGCAGSLDEPTVPLTLPSRLCDARDEHAECVDALDVERWLAREDLVILDARATPQGKQGAKVLTLAARGARRRIVFHAKWRAQSTAHALNVPFREVAAHAVQKLFLAPGEWVVPPAASVCFELEAYRQSVDAKATPTLGGSRCVLGVISYWIEQGSGVSEIFDEQLFWRSEIYRRSLANVNLMSYLIDHGDSYPGQFVSTGSSDAPRIHLVDNTIAFSAYRNPRIPAAWDFSRLRVPALPRSSIERLAALSPRELDALRVIEQFDLGSAELVREPPLVRLASRERNFVRVDGKLVLGLTDREIARLARRIHDVVERVRQGRIRTFE